MRQYLLRFGRTPVSPYLSGNPVCDPTAGGWKPLIWVRNPESAHKFPDEQSALDFLAKSPMLEAVPVPYFPA